MTSPLQEPQDDSLTLSLSLPYSSSPPLSPLPAPTSAPSPPQPSPFQFISLSHMLQETGTLPASPRLSPFQYIPLTPPPLTLPSQLIYTQHYQEPHPLTPPYPPNISQDESSSGEAQPLRTSGSSSSSNNPSRAVRRRRDVRSDVPPPFPWATSKRAIVHSLDHLRSQGVTEITGTVTCKRCDEQRDITFNLEEKFNNVARFIEENKFDMHDRAPECWSNPMLPKCERCDTENSLKPVITKKRSINWLFLLLGQMLGCCKLEQLKYFCKHAMNHRTGAKDRLLYSTYIGLCKQLHPEGPYE